MGRPRAFDRNEALDIAMNEIWRNGYETSSVSALAETLGITRSSFYNAFGDRRAMFEEILARYAAQAPDSALDEIEPGQAVLPAIADMFEEVCAVRAADPEARGCMVVNSVAELVGVNEEVSPTLAEAFRSGTERFRRLLEQAAAQGEIPKALDREETALALQNLLVGLNVMSKVIRDERALLGIARTTLAGLRLQAGGCLEE